MLPVESADPGLLQRALKHPVVVLLGVVAGGLAGYAYLQWATPLYTSSARLQVRPDVPRLIGEAEPRLAIDGESSFVNAERVVLSSTPVLSAALRERGPGEMAFFAKADDPVAYLRKRLRIEIGRKDGILSLELDAADPGEGVALLGGVVQAYIEYQREQGRRTAESLLRMLAEEKVRCEAKIASQVEALAGLRRSGGVGAFGGGASAAMEALAALRESLKAARAEADHAEAVFSGAMRAYGEGPEHARRVAELEEGGAMVITSDAEDAQVRWTIAELQLKLNEMLRQNQYLPNHPQVKAVQSRLDELLPAYVAGAKSRWAAAAQRQARIEREVERQQAVVEGEAAMAAQYAAAQGELRRLERHADLIEARMNEVRTSQSAGAMRVTVVDPARVEAKPSKPKVVNVMAAAVLAGLVLGVGLASRRERVMPRLRSLAEVKAVVGAPVLGLFPRIHSLPGGGGGALPAGRQPLSRIAEACRTIRSAIHFGSPGSFRKLLVTSAARGDGKTTVAANLGAVLAQDGKRVLVVDLDARHASLHRVFEISDRTGLGSVLLGQEALSAAIQRTGVEGLHILPAGPPPRRGWQPVTGGALHELLEQLAGQYDHVLIDGPAACESSDARVLATWCDAAVLVVRIGRTDPRLAESAYQGLAGLGARILGVVVNAVPGSAARDVSYFETAGALALSERASVAVARARAGIAKEAAGTSSQRV